VPFQGKPNNGDWSSLLNCSPERGLRGLRRWRNPPLWKLFMSSFLSAYQWNLANPPKKCQLFNSPIWFRLCGSACKHVGATSICGLQRQARVSSTEQDALIPQMDFIIDKIPIVLVLGRTEPPFFHWFLHAVSLWRKYRLRHFLAVLETLPRFISVEEVSWTSFLIKILLNRFWYPDWTTGYCL